MVPGVTRVWFWRRCFYHILLLSARLLIYSIEDGYNVHIYVILVFLHSYH